MKSGELRVMAASCVLLVSILAVRVTHAQDQFVAEETRLRKIIDEGKSEERSAAIKLLMSRGKEEPYRSIIRKWLSQYWGSNFDCTIARIVAHLRDEEFLALAVEALVRIQDNLLVSYSGICAFLKTVFAEVEYAPVVPVLEGILKKPVPEPPSGIEELRRNGPEWLLRVKVAAGKALIKQKGREAVHLLRQAQEELFVVVRAVQKRGENEPNRYLDVSRHFDKLLHKLNLEYACMIAEIAWDEERPKYVSMIQEDDPYKRYFALYVFIHVKDKTTVRYMIPLLDDLRPAIIPISEITRQGLREYLPTRNLDNYEDVLEVARSGYIKGCTRALVLTAWEALKAVTGVFPVMEADGSIKFISTSDPLDGRYFNAELPVFREAWKQWWEENKDKPEYVEGY